MLRDWSSSFGCRADGCTAALGWWHGCFHLQMFPSQLPPHNPFMVGAAPTALCPGSTAPCSPMFKTHRPLLQLLLHPTALCPSCF